VRHSDAERRIILLSAGTTALRTSLVHQAESLVDELDWHALAETLRARKLLPTLGPRIIGFAGATAPEDFVAAVGQALDTGRRQGALLQLLSLRVIGLLADAGIPASPLKGPLLGEAIYGDVGRRLSTDVDLLVDRKSLNAAVDVVTNMGYDPPKDHVEHSGLPLLHFALANARGDLPPIEIHWRIHWYEERFAQERLLPSEPDPDWAWRPAPADELVALLLFYARDGFVDLRLAADLGAWWDVFGERVPRGALDRTIREYPQLARPIAVSLNVAERLVGLPKAELLEAPPQLDLRERMAVRLANPNPDSSRSQLYADIGLVDGLLTPAGDLKAFVRRQIVPPRDVLAQQARHGARRRRRSLLGRGTGMLARYGLTMTRLARQPETPR
jgi:Uncharacterised nucleotidyltransferase